MSSDVTFALVEGIAIVAACVAVSILCWIDRRRERREDLECLNQEYQYLCEEEEGGEGDCERV